MTGRKAKETVKLLTEGDNQGELGNLDVLPNRQTYFENSLDCTEALTELQKVMTEIFACN